MSLFLDYEKEGVGTLGIKKIEGSLVMGLGQYCLDFCNIEDLWLVKLQVVVLV
jgi:hypothetical protein